MPRKTKAKATAPATFVDDLRWKSPSSGWFEDIEAQTAYDKIPEWLRNFDCNLRTIGFDHSVSSLPKIHGSALVIDKGMASTQFWRQARYLSRYRGTIIACDRALYSILQYDVVNQAKNVYVCNLDSSWLCMSFFDRPDVKKVMDKITAVFSVTTFPLTIRLWHGKRVFFTPYMASFPVTKALMELSKTDYMHHGGQVASFAWILAYNLGANPIGVFGVTHGYDKIEETEYPLHKEVHEDVEGPYGTCKQDPVYGWYNAVWLDYIRLAAKENVTTINTMKGGLLYSGDVVDLSLREFVKSFQ